MPPGEGLSCLVSFGLLTLKRWLELDFPENAIVLIVKDLTWQSWFLAGMESMLKNLVSPSLSWSVFVLNLKDMVAVVVILRDLVWPSRLLLEIVLNLKDLVRLDRWILISAF